MKAKLVIFFAAAMSVMVVHGQNSSGTAPASGVGSTPTTLPGQPQNPTLPPTTPGTRPIPRPFPPGTGPGNPVTAPGVATNFPFPLTATNNPATNNPGFNTNGLGFSNRFGINISNVVSISNVIVINFSNLPNTLASGTLSNGSILLISNTDISMSTNPGIPVATTTNGTPSFILSPANPLMGRFVVSNTPSASGNIPDIFVTPTDQAIVTRIRQVVQPQNNQVNSPGLTPVHLAVQNGAVTLLGYVPTTVEKQRVLAMVQRVPGVTRVIDQLHMTTDALSVTTAAGSPSLPGTLNSGTNLSPTGFLTNSAIFSNSAAIGSGGSISNTNSASVTSGTNATSGTTGTP